MIPSNNLFLALTITATIAALDGAEVIYVPSASPARGFQGGYPENVARWRTLAQAVAAEHGLYGVVASLVGFEGGKGMSGGSLVVGPDGRVLAEAPLFEEAALLFALDRERIPPVRYDSPLLSDLEAGLPLVPKEADAVVFLGLEALGYPYRLGEAKALVPVPVALIEGTPQAGLGAFRDQGILRLFSLRYEWLLTLKPEEAAEKYGLAARERSHQILYLRPYPYPEDTARLLNVTYHSSLEVSAGASEHVDAQVIEQVFGVNQRAQPLFRRAALCRHRHDQRQHHGDGKPQQNQRADQFDDGKPMPNCVPGRLDDFFTTDH